MKTLTQIFSKIGHFGEDVGHNDKGGVHSYLETYEKLFSPFRNGCTLLEIGLAQGMSMKLWDKYFTNSQIVGADISIVFEKFNSENKNQLSFIECDATKLHFLDSVNSFNFNIIIDDGSHMENDQVNTFLMLKHKMVKGGVYIIEDILALDQNRTRFESLHDNCEIVDMRKDNGRFDNVLICYRF